MHDTRGPLGDVYLDLHQRTGKYTGNAHFTIRCGKRLPDGGYRRPIVALVCSFDRHDSLLTFEEVRCGHAAASTCVQPHTGLRA
jgi:Zn-dependent oligopeptidase